MLAATFRCLPVPNSFLEREAFDASVRMSLPAISKLIRERRLRTGFNGFEADETAALSQLSKEKRLVKTRSVVT